MPISSHCFCPCDKRAGEPVAVIAEADRRQDAVDASPARVGRAPPNSVANTRARRLGGEQDVVVDGVVLEHRRLLELAADAEFGDLGLVELGQIVAALEIDVACRRAASCR